MHDATSRKKGMDHVSKNRCHEEETHCGNGGLRPHGHGHAKEDQLNGHYGCMNAWRACMWTTTKAKGKRACEQGLKPIHKRKEVNRRAPPRKCAFLSSHLSLHLFGHVLLTPPSLDHHIDTFSPTFSQVEPHPLTS